MKAMLLVGAVLFTGLCIFSVSVGIDLVREGAKAASEASADLKKLEAEGNEFARSLVGIGAIGNILTAELGACLIVLGAVPIWFIWPFVYLCWLIIDRLSRADKPGLGSLESGVNRLSIQELPSEAINR